MTEGRIDYPAQQPLSVPQLDTGVGEVRLLLCTTRDRLAKMLSVLWESRGLQPIVWNDPESGADLDTLDHMIDLLEALAFLNDNINEAPCAPEEPIFFDDPDSVDAQEDSGGESGLLEMIGDWVIEGFLAVTVSPAAALVYKTVIPRARVALRTGNLGALFQIVVDGVGVVATGDTYSATPDILEVEFDTGPAGIFRVEYGGGGAAAAALGASPQSDSYRLEVVRGDIRPYPEGGTMPTYTLAWDNVTCTMQLLADGVPISSVPLDNSCLVGPPGPAGEPGPQGLQGPTGPQGPPGADGQDADCDTCRDVQIDVNIEVPNPDNLPPDDIACNIASFITDLVLPSTKDRLDQATAQATAEKQLATVVLETIGTLGAGFVLGPAGIVFGAAVTGTGGITSIFWDSKGSAFIAPADMWQQLKCIIHCEIINSGQEAYTTAVNAAVVARLGELLPLAQQETIDWLSLQLGLLSAEGFQWLNYYGALWEGSNCAVCECGECKDCGEYSETVEIPIGTLVGTGAGFAFQTGTPNVNATADGCEIPVNPDDCISAVTVHFYNFFTANTAAKRTWLGFRVYDGDELVEGAGNVTDGFLAATATFDARKFTTGFIKLRQPGSPQGDNFYITGVQLTRCTDVPPEPEP